MAIDHLLELNDNVKLYSKLTYSSMYKTMKIVPFLGQQDRSE